MTPPTKPIPPADKAFSLWCVMHHARPALLQALNAWGLHESASAIGATHSLSALKLTVMDAYREIHRVMLFGPVRRDLILALNTLQVAAALAGRGESENTAAMSLGVFTGAAGAIAWRRPWQRLRWRKRRAEVIARARQEQVQMRRGTSGLTDPARSIGSESENAE